AGAPISKACAALPAPSGRGRRPARLPTEPHDIPTRTRPAPGEQPAALSDDFTQGSIPRKLIVFALPILVANLLQGSMQLVNVLWVGNLLGSRALAAVTV